MTKSTLATVLGVTLGFVQATIAEAQSARANTDFGFLSISGSNGDDEIRIYEREQQGWYDYHSFTWRPAGTYVVWWIRDSSGKWVDYDSVLKSEIRSIAVQGNNGDDIITVDSDLDTNLDGGSGSDFILGGSGSDVIRSGPGIWDHIDGRAGADLLIAAQKPFFFLRSSDVTFLIGGSGADTFIYQNTDHVTTEQVATWGYNLRPDFVYSRGEHRGLGELAE